MRRDDDRAYSRPARFGPLDPFCWLLIAPLLMSAGVMIVTTSSGAGVAYGIGVLCAAIALALFDKWANRPLPEPSRSVDGRDRRATREEDRRTAQRLTRSGR